MEPPSLTPSVLLCGDDPSSQGEPRALSKQGLHSKTRTWLLRGLCLRTLLPGEPAVPEPSGALGPPVSDPAHSVLQEGHQVVQ